MEYSLEYEVTEELVERYELIKERIQELVTEQELPEHLNAFFVKYGLWSLELMKVYETKQEEMACWNVNQQEELQQKLYMELLEKNYSDSYCNPVVSVGIFGEALGRLISCFAADFHSCIQKAYQKDLFYLVIWLEQFVQWYGIGISELEEGNQLDVEYLYQQWSDTFYWFYHDYCEIFVARQVHQMLTTDHQWWKDYLMQADWSKEESLYGYGAYIGENQRQIQSFLKELPQEQIESMAKTFTQGYYEGFAATNKDISKKKTVKMEYPIGFERVAQEQVKMFEDMGLEVVIQGEALTSFEGRGVEKRGCFATSCNPQFDYDHKDDKALYFDKSFVQRRLEVLKDSYEKHKQLAKVYGGPAVMEVFGATPFTPVNKKENITYSQQQQKLLVSYGQKAGELIQEYIPGSEYSFTIIAYPIPEIGKDFKEIFAQTVALNTLDSKAYQKMQQNMIEVLDQGHKVYITGRNGNETNLTVALHELKDSQKETNFENCVADVNIPVGEVFTSPLLNGTNGTLHVKKVYLKGYEYKNLKLEFSQGMVTKYSCDNFSNEEENQKLIQDQLLYHHNTLPMGEFAIGTNTLAYRMARDFQIQDKLPILIAEKTGPHFAIGDTCYSHGEEVAMYNPDGKEVIAKSNEWVDQYKLEEPQKAYFQCHTDITIPYDELGEIYIENEKKEKVFLMKEGKFVVKGTEELNLPL